MDDQYCITLFVPISNEYSVFNLLLFLCSPSWIIADIYNILLVSLCQHFYLDDLVQNTNQLSSFKVFIQFHIFCIICYFCFCIWAVDTLYFFYNCCEHMIVFIHWFYFNYLFRKIIEFPLSLFALKQLFIMQNILRNFRHRKPRKIKIVTCL